MLTICSALSASCARRAAIAVSLLAVLSARFILTLGAILILARLDTILEDAFDIVLDEGGDDLVFFCVPVAASGFAYAIEERVFLAVERVVTVIANLLEGGACVRQKGG